LQLQSPSENLPTVKPRASRLSAALQLQTTRELAHCQAKSMKTVSFIPGPDIIRELSTFCQVKSINTISFIPALATMRKLTAYQATSIKTVSFIPAPATIRELTLCQAKII